MQAEEASPATQPHCRGLRARVGKQFPTGGLLLASRSIYLGVGRRAIHIGNLFASESSAAPLVPVCFPLLYTDRLNRDIQPDLRVWIEQLRSGDIRALARAISVVENHAPGWSDLLKALFPHSGHARIIGLTGSPGAGKSTLVDQLARLYRAGGDGDAKRSIGIIAVDPTSPYTGGAILGDRIRMQEHFSDPGIYIRSMATRGSLGGLARTTADVTTVLDASGRDLIMI